MFHLLKLAVLTEYQNSLWNLTAIFVDKMESMEKDYSLFEGELQTVVDALTYFKNHLNRSTLTIYTENRVLAKRIP